MASLIELDPDGELIEQAEHRRNTQAAERLAIENQRLRAELVKQQTPPVPSGIEVAARIASMIVTGLSQPPAAAEPRRRAKPAPRHVLPSEWAAEDGSGRTMRDDIADGVIDAATVKWGESLEDGTPVLEAADGAYVRTRMHTRTPDEMDQERDNPSKGAPRPRPITELLSAGRTNVPATQAAGRTRSGWPTDSRTGPAGKVVVSIKPPPGQPHGNGPSPLWRSAGLLRLWCGGRWKADDGLLAK